MSLFQKSSKMPEISCCDLKMERFCSYSASSHNQAAISISSTIPFKSKIAGLLKLPLIKMFVTGPIAAAIVILLTGGCMSAETSQKTIWRKGAIHTHTLWSDGRALPEVAVKSYKDLKYDFLCLSEHNLFPEGEWWMPVASEEGKWPPNLSRTAFRHAEKMLPGKIISRERGFRTFVRLRTFKELQEMFEEKGKFVLIPGGEYTLSFLTPAGELYNAHFNVFNAVMSYQAISGKTPEECMMLNYAQYLKAAKKAPEKSFYMVNHPQYRYWDIDPVLLVRNPQMTHFEICNGAVPPSAVKVCSMEKYWDFVLAHRIVNGHKIIYATASDDAHFYINSIGKPAGLNCGWVMVNTPELTPDKISEAMNRGDFYPSCGVELENIIYNRAEKKLTVQVKPEKNVNYTISFIVTKKDFDRKIVSRKYEHKNKQFNREFTVIPENIGVTALTVKGTTGTYTLKEDDLYVRAVIRSDKKITFGKAGGYPEYQTAWTQPLVK